MSISEEDQQDINEVFRKLGEFNEMHTEKHKALEENNKAIDKVFRKAYKQAAANRINPLKGLPTRTS